MKESNVTSQIEKLSPTKICLTIEVDAAKVKMEGEKVFSEMAKGAQVKGFRKGKAPRKMVEKMIDQKLFDKEVLNRLVGEAYEQAVKSHKIRPMTAPELEVLSFKTGEALKFKATLERRPDIALPDYKQVEVTVPRHELKAEEVEKTLQTLREQRATYENLPSGIVEEGRGALVDLQAFVAGRPLEGGSWQGVTLDIQKEWPVIPGLMEKMFGMKDGEEREIKVTLPKSFEGEAAGKEATFKVRVHGVKEKKIPPLDDAFALHLSSEFKTLEDLKAAVRKQVQAMHEHEEKSEGLRKVLDEWSGTLKIEAPDVLVEEKMKQLERELLQILQQQGRDFASFLREKHPEVFSIQGPKEEEKIDRALAKLREEMRPQAAKQAKVDLILDEISQREGLKVTQEEVNSEVGRLAQSFRMTPEAVAKALRDQKIFHHFIGGMLRAKAAIMLRDRLKINY